jgi:hypothetical protein
MELPLHPSDPEIDTTRQEKVARRKRRVLELATELGNVSKACRVMGYSRQHFCEIRRNLQTFGAESRGYGPRTPSRAAAPTTAAIRAHPVRLEGGATRAASSVCSTRCSGGLLRRHRGAGGH